MKFLLLTALALLPQNPAPTPPAPAPAQQGAESAAWDAAAALQTRADYPAAAAAFERFRSDFPNSPRALEAQVRSGICWFSDGNAKRVNHAVTDGARASFELSLARFESVTKEHAQHPLSSRAQYMKGSVHLFQGDLEAARREYSAVLEKFSADRNYVGKALERRAVVERHLLRPREALVDMQRWMKEFGSPEDTLKAVQMQIALAPKLERPAPAYRALHWLNGPATLESCAGQVVALYFFATWCSNCPKETPYLVDLQRRYGSRGFKLVGVMNNARGQTPEVVGKYLADNQLGFSVMIDAGETARTYGSTNVPYVALIDMEGRLRFADHPSLLTDWTVEALLDGHPVQPPPGAQK